MNVDVKNVIISKTSLNKVYMVNQEKPIVLASYYVIDDIANGALICEVSNTGSFPMLTNKFLDEINSCMECADLANLDRNKVTYYAELKILKNLQVPVTPLSKVVSASFEEIKPYISPVPLEEGFAIGVIMGTEFMQKDLPLELQNVAPLWKNGVAIDQEGCPLILEFKVQREYPHIFLSGSSGSGKSASLRVLLECMMEHKLPALVVDMHNEMNFNIPMPGIKNKIDYTSCYEIFVVGKDIGIPFHELTTKELVTLISHKEALTDAQKRVLEKIHKEGMSQQEFKHILEVLAETFGKMSAYKADEKNLSPEELHYYKAFKNYVTSPDTIRSLLGKFYVIEESNVLVKNTVPVKNCLKQRKLAIIRGNVDVANMVLTYMVNRLYRERRSYIDLNVNNVNDERFIPPFFIVLDECHKFAANDSFNNPTKLLLRKLAQESRKYGVYLIMCTQGPRLLDKVLLDQMNTKIFLRTEDVENKEIARNEIGLTQVEYDKLPNLSSGQGFISAAYLTKTFLIQFRSSFTLQPKAEDIFAELDNLKFGDDSKNEIQDIICNWISTTDKPDSRGLPTLLIELNKQGNSFDMKDLISIMKELEQNKVIIIEDNLVGQKYKLV